MGGPCRARAQETRVKAELKDQREKGSKKKVVDAEKETSISYPPEKLDKKAREIEKKLLLILLAYIAGTLKKDIALKQGLAIIEESFKLLVNEINEFYREAGLSGQLKPESEQLKKTRDRITEEFERILDAKSEYWKSEEGTRHATMLLALLVPYSIAAQIAISVAKKTPEAYLLWDAVLDEKTCFTCEALHGTICARAERRGG